MKLQRSQLVAQMPRGLTHHFVYDDQVLTAEISWSAATNFATDFIVWLRTDDALLKPGLVHRDPQPITPADPTAKQHEVDEQVTHADSAIDGVHGQTRTSPDITVIDSQSRNSPERMDTTGPSSTQLGTGDMAGTTCGESQVDPDALPRDAVKAIELDAPTASAHGEHESSSVNDGTAYVLNVLNDPKPFTFYPCSAQSSGVYYSHHGFYHATRSPSR